MEFIKKTLAWYNRPKSKTADFFESLIVIVPLAFAIRTIFFGLYKVPTGSMETTMLCGEYYFADKLTPFFKEFAYGDIIATNDPTYQYSDNVLIQWWQRYVGFPFQVINWTKRVIGKPGDHIKGAIENGKPVIYRNGIKLDEPYLNRYSLIPTMNVSQTHPLFRSYDPAIPYNQQPFYRLNQEDVVLGKRFMERIGHEWLRKPGEPEVHMTYAGTIYERPYDVFEVTLGPDEYWTMGDNRRDSHDSRAWGPLKKRLIHARILFRIWSFDSDESWAIFDLLKHPIDFWSRIRWNRCFQVVH